MNAKKTILIISRQVNRRGSTQIGVEEPTAHQEEEEGEEGGDKSSFLTIPGSREGF
jgi:hypothetical protein